MFVSSKRHDMTLAENEKLTKDARRSARLYLELEEQHADQLSDLKRQHKRELFNKDLYIEELELENKALEVNKGKEAELRKKELELEAQEVIILNTTTEHTLFEEKLDNIRDEYEAKLAKLTEEAELEERRDYKKGYADGLADGMREATKITAEDRQLLAKVASVAAASHTPQGVAELMLESGKKDNGK